MKLEGALELRTKLKKCVDMDEVKKIVNRNGGQLQNKMQRHAEAAFVKGYSTGATKRSIALDIQDGGLTVEVEPGTNYAAYVEYGTRFMEAEPFVKPAFDQQKKIFKDDMKDLTN